MRISIKSTKSFFFKCYCYYVFFIFQVSTVFYINFKPHEIFLFLNVEKKTKIIIWHLSSVNACTNDIDDDTIKVKLIEGGYLDFGFNRIAKTRFAWISSVTHNRSIRSTDLIESHTDSGVCV